jgi:hypothetical protein
MSIDVEKTQLICWRLFHLYWEVEKRTKRCHTRTRAAAAGRDGPGRGRDVRAEPGREWERFYLTPITGIYFLFDAWDPISAEALQLRRRRPFPSYLFTYPGSPIYCPIWNWFGWQTEHYNSLYTNLPVPWLARTGLWESRSLRNVRRSRVHLLGWRPAITFLGSVFDTSTRYWCSVVFLYCSWSVGFLYTRYCLGRKRGSTLQPFCTALSGTTTPTNAMSTSAGLNASGYNLFRLLVVIYIFAYSAKSNMVMNIASGLLLISISWIKLLVNLAKFPTQVPFSLGRRVGRRRASSFARAASWFRVRLGSFLQNGRY